MGGLKKCCSNDVVVGDLCMCDFYPDWCEQAQNPSTWCEWIYTSAVDMNEEIEALEQSNKDEHKQRKETSSQKMHLGLKM